MTQQEKSSKEDNDIPQQPESTEENAPQNPSELEKSDLTPTKKRKVKRARPSEATKQNLQQRLKNTRKMKREQVKQKKSWPIAIAVVFIVAITIIFAIVSRPKPKKKIIRVDAHGRHLRRVPTYIFNVKDDFYLLSLDQICKLPDEKIDFAWTALLVAQDDFITFKKRVHIRKQMKLIQRHAQKIQDRIRNKHSAEQVIGIINNYLYKKEKFTTSQIGWDPSNLYLNLIMEGKQAYCLGYVELWMALGERIFWRGKPLPLFGVKAPYHIFCRWDDGKYQRNIETLHVPPPNWKPSVTTILSAFLIIKDTEKIPLEAGRYLSNSYYQENYGINQISVQSKMYLANVDKKAVISSIFSNRASLRLDHLEYAKDIKRYKTILKKAFSDMKTSLLWYPENIHARRGWASLQVSYMGKFKEAAKSLEEMEKVDPCCRTLTLLSRAYLGLKKYDRALQCLNKAEKALAFSDREKQMIPYYRAQVLYQSKRYKEAQKYIEKVLKKDIGEHMATKFMFLNVMVLNKLKEFDKAFALLYTMKYLLGESYLLNEHMGELYRHKKEWQKAKEFYELTLSEDKENIAALCGLGEYYLVQKKYQKAIQYLEKALLENAGIERAQKNLEKVKKLLKEQNGAK